ncbi:hypothetical protein FDO65_14480 [Nakamurella flava]|uniref:Uncharacterized protein n=1 Tax=Nakamurella flava TaxID=2576308 RepID=A0A4U6QF65_9ACTN|nr:hypothetical protein FDO65_14480 [Nakamurella flava]
MLSVATGGGCGNAGLVAPKLTYPTSEGSCSGPAVVGSAVYVACARGQRLYRAEISGSSLVNPQQYFVGTFGRPRTVEPAGGCASARTACSLSPPAAAAATPGSSPRS